MNKGDKVNRWTAISESYMAGTSRKHRVIDCQCECGTVKTVNYQHLISGRSKSCGCFQREKARERLLTHGNHETRLYRIWTGARSRCYCPQKEPYKSQKLQFATEWDDFEVFQSWAFANGYTDQLTLDRINNEKGYSPENCRWATMKEQNRNKRNNHRITINGITKTMEEWSEHYGISSRKVEHRLKRGWPAEKALTN